MATIYTKHENWTSRFTFLMAAVGAAVGLGNIWKFPYVTGQNGGSAFVLVYLLAIFIVAMPIMMGEMVLGRRGRMSASRWRPTPGKQSLRQRLSEACSTAR
mgnify:CR=1 FL=1